MSGPDSDRRVFVDTSAYYATADRRDADHAAAAATMQRLRIGTALSLDRHFAQYGWQLIPVEEDATP